MIPLVDLKGQYAELRPEIDAAVTRVLESGRFVLGSEVEAFESEFAAYCGAAYAVGVDSGTSALHLALRAAGVGPGDEVITVPFTFIATVSSIAYTGARPVLVDVDPDSLTIDVNQIEAAITSRTKAIIPVHLYGHPADMDAILDIGRRRGLIVIEDAAQAHGAAHRGRPAGSMGNLGCFSFYPSKNLGAYGDGGAVTTNDPELARRVRSLRNWASEQPYCHETLAFNNRLDELQAAILRVKLGHLDADNDCRRAHAAHYNRRLKAAGVHLPCESPGTRHVYHLYAVRVAAREPLQAHLGARAIGTGIHYPVPVHLQPAFRDLGYGVGSFPESERAASEVLSLPMYPGLEEADIERVADAVLEGMAG